MKIGIGNDHVAVEYKKEISKYIEEKYGYMVGFQNNEIVPVPLSEVAGKLKMVDPDSSIIKETRGLGISFGD